MKKVPVSVNAVHEDALYVNWHLLDGCNHDCEYSHEPESAVHERFSRESVLTAAYRLLSLNRPEYVFHLYGGEPTIHPYFPELFKYLATSGRNVRMVLDTNGLRSLDYYRQLLKGIPHGRLCVHIDVHCKYMELEPLLLLVAHVVEAGQFCRVTVNHVPEYADKARMLSEKLLMLRNTLPFDMAVAFPMGGGADWLYAVQQSFAEIVEPTLEMPVWAFPVREESVVAFLPDEFVCVGINGVQVAPDGSFLLGLCEKDRPFAPQILEHVELRAGFPSAPSFATLAEAEAWFAGVCVRTLRYELDGGPVRHPLHADMDEEQQLRVRLKRLKAESSYRRKRAPQPELWRERQADVLSALACLEDEDSRTAFLRYLKSCLTGDSAYLVRSSYARSGHPCLEDGDGLYGDSGPLRLPDGATPESVAALLPRIQWYHPVFECALPQTSEWVDVILALRAALPDYHLYFGQHGLQAVLYGAPSVPHRRALPVPPRTVDGTPLVSMVLVASDNAEDVARSIESMLAQGLPRYEIIVVQDADVSGLGDAVDAFVRREPWRVRPFRLTESLGFSASCNAGLDMAQGEYVCFLHCGDTLKDSIVAAAVNALEAEQADVAVTLPYLTKNNSTEGSAVLTRFLTGQLGQCGTRDKVYRSSVIREHAVVFADVPGEMEDDLFNLPLFLFARKAVGCAGELSDRSHTVGTTSEDVFKAFLVNLDTFSRFCAAHGLDMGPEARAYVLRRFKEIKPDFLRVVREAESTGRLDDVLDDAALRALTLTPAIVQDVCEEFASVYCKATGISVELFPAPASVPWRRHSGAADAFELEYPLSIVVTVEEGASLVCLERLSQEDCGLVECVVIDNGTSEETAVVLEDYADMYPNFRLFRMKEKALAAQCRNAGLEEAGGAAVTFMESGDEPMPDFVAAATDALRSGTEDIFAFGVQRMKFDGVTGFSLYNSDIRTGTEAVKFFFEKEIRLDPAGMVFRRKLFSENITFNPIVPEWNADFVLRALHDAAVRIMPEVACIHQEQESEPFVVAYQGSIEAGCGFYAFLQRFMEEGNWNEQALSGLHKRVSQSVKRTWLPLCVAQMHGSNGDMVLPEAKFSLPNLLLRTVLAEYATFESADN